LGSSNNEQSTRSRQSTKGISKITTPTTTQLIPTISEHARRSEGAESGSEGQAQQQQSCADDLYDFAEESATEYDEEQQHPRNADITESTERSYTEFDEEKQDKGALSSSSSSENFEETVSKSVENQQQHQRKSGIDELNDMSLTEEVFQTPSAP
jgi:uncharacterized membrane protein YccC